MPSVTQQIIERIQKHRILAGLFTFVLLFVALQAIVISSSNPSDDTPTAWISPRKLDLQQRVPFSLTLAVPGVDSTELYTVPMSVNMWFQITFADEVTATMSAVPESTLITRSDIENGRGFLQGGVRLRARPEGEAFTPVFVVGSEVRLLGNDGEGHIQVQDTERRVGWVDESQIVVVENDPRHYFEIAGRGIVGYLVAGTSLYGSMTSVGIDDPLLGPVEIQMNRIESIQITETVTETVDDSDSSAVFTVRTLGGDEYTGPLANAAKTLYLITPAAVIAIDGQETQAELMLTAVPAPEPMEE